MDDQKNFGAILRKLRVENGMSQNDVCSKLGYSQQNISSWETGKAMPASDALLELLDLYGVDNILEEFGYGNSEIEEFTPTPKEKQLLIRFRKLPRSVKNAIATIISYCYKALEDVQSEPTLIAASGAENLNEEEMRLLEKDIEMVKNLGKKS